MKSGVVLHRFEVDVNVIENPMALDGNILYAALRDGTFSSLNIDSGEFLEKKQLHNYEIKSMALSVTAKLLVSGSSKGGTVLSSMTKENTTHKVYISGNNKRWITFDEERKEFMIEGDKGFLFKKNNENRTLLSSLH